MKVLAVVAHPDDETFGLGSALAHAAALGAEVSVWCATHGEAGEPAPGCGITEAGPELGDARADELREAAAILGIAHVEVGNFGDSGMLDEPPVGSLAAVPLDVVVAAVREAIERTEPDLVVTLDASDGHRDHVRIREAVVEAAFDVAWVYVSCLPRSLLQRWLVHAQEADPGRAHLDPEIAAVGTPDELVTTLIDTAIHVPRRWAAIRAHRSQVSPFEGLPSDLEQAFLATDHLQRLSPPWSGGPIETDLGPIVARRV